MQEANKERSIKEVVSETVASLIDIAVERLYREKLLAASQPQSDVIQMDDVTEQLNQEIGSLKRSLATTAQKLSEIIDKVENFRSKLKVRHEKVGDNVLQKYNEFFNLTE